MEFVENVWHHACLSFLKLKPTAYNNYRDADLDFTCLDVQNIINKYGIMPPHWHVFWDTLAETDTETIDSDTDDDL